MWKLFHIRTGVELTKALMLFFIIFFCLVCSFGNFLVAAATLSENIRQTLSTMRWRKCRKCWKSPPNTWLWWLRPNPLRHRKTENSSGKIAVKTLNLGHSILGFMILLPVSLLFSSLSHWRVYYFQFLVKLSKISHLYSTFFYCCPILYFFFSSLSFFKNVINVDDNVYYLTNCMVLR